MQLCDVTAKQSFPSARPLCCSCSEEGFGFEAQVYHLRDISISNTSIFGCYKVLYLEKKKSGWH